MFKFDHLIICLLKYYIFISGVDGSIWDLLQNAAGFK